MPSNIITKSQTRPIFEVLGGIGFLTLGCAIYLLFRSETLNIYQWANAVGFSESIDSLRDTVREWRVPNFVRFSLPDGLYCAAYILMMDAIWHEDNGLIKYAVISIVPIVTISSEILQYFGLVKGTFDVCDLICYMIPPMIYFIYIFNSLKFNNLNF